MCRKCTIEPYSFLVNYTTTFPSDYLLHLERKLLIVSFSKHLFLTYIYNNHNNY